VDATVTTVELKISSRSQDDVAVVTVGGEIDLYTAPQLRTELVESLALGARRLVVDMSRAEFCDSTGISVLLSAMKRSRDRGGDLELVAPKPAVMKVLQVTGLDEVFVIHPDVDASLVAAGTGSAQ
jgi:anti-sigma B factor antagonist